MTFETIPDILEVTLRDGSYLIDFQFTAEDTATIAGALEGIGFRWIEVGHGLGLNASQSGKGMAAATDEEYMEAAAQALQHAKWGMFFIPGIGREEDIRLAATTGCRSSASAPTSPRPRRPSLTSRWPKELGLIGLV
jgi:isopropylmalate/homocitrate/citramalate synthase